MNGRERIPCDYAKDCPQAKANGGKGCREDIHHRYWPEKAYKTLVEKAFRNLLPNTVKTCRRIHQEIHDTEDPPEKPSRDLMVRAIDLANQALQKIRRATEEQRREARRMELRGCSSTELRVLRENWQGSRKKKGMLVELADEILAERGEIG